MSLLSVTSVPKLRWSSPNAFNIKPPFASAAFLILGLVVFGLGEALLVTAGVGVSPWTLLAEGVTNVTGWSLGFATFVISVSVLGLWIPLKQTPGMGTILNAIIIALVLEYVLPFLPTFESYAANSVLALVGVFVTGSGGAIYLIANLGPGPRDGLMTGLQAVTGRPIALVRTALECTVVAIGWALGGTLGLGTVFYALGIGPAMAIAMRFLQLRGTAHSHL
ncbi:YczE/YyaS/YitT family protein [Hoeflea sp.]|uniref:membrane protein YczE n=1 Tax=Hoeflea sp. TaxID=1940281 RepID=UPI003A919B31